MKKRILNIILFCMSTISLTACTSEISKNSLQKDPVTQIANPFINCETLDDAAEIAGFYMYAPENIKGYNERKISVIENNLIQVGFYNSYTNSNSLEDDLSPDNYYIVDSLYLRKALGNEDISGDYNSYSLIKDLDINGVTVTLKGFENTFNVAVWNSGSFSYAIGSSISLQENEIIEYIEDIINGNMIPGSDPATWGPVGNEDASTQISNPFTEYSSLEEAEKQVGFEIKIPESINNDSHLIYRVSYPIIEILYKNNYDEIKTRIRKSPVMEDISGDYTSYPDEITLSLEDFSVKLKGYSEKVMLATWTSNGYSYSISSTGITADNMIKLVQEIQ